MKQIAGGQETEVKMVFNRATGKKEPKVVIVKEHGDDCLEVQLLKTDDSMHKEAEMENV